MNPQERFAVDHKMPLPEVRLLVGRAHLAARCNERACNGDPHALSMDRTNKAHNASLWERDVETVAQQIAHLITAYGFTAVVFNGLGPTLKRGEQFVEVPY